MFTVYTSILIVILPLKKKIPLMCLPPAAEPPTPKKNLYLAYISTKGSRSVLIYTSAYLSCHDLFFHLLGLLNLLPSTTLTAVLAWDCHGNTYMHESVWDRERET